MAQTITAYDDRDEIYGELQDHFMRIGDTQFYVPPTAISVHRQMKTQKVTLLRGRNSLPKESGYFDRVITITLFFPNMDSINYELRPILAQAKKCPFLPIENVYLNDIHKIEAITIQNVTVQTTPGFPNTLQAIIQCYAFEPSTYIYGTSDRSFDEMFNWPLFRWYYNQNLKPSDGKRHLTFFEPLIEDLNDSYLFRIVAEDDLREIREWRIQKQKLIKEWIADKSNKAGPDFEDWLKFRWDKEQGLQWGNEAAEAEFEEKYNEMYSKAKYEYDLHYEPWDVGDLFLQEFSISFENVIVSQQLQMHQSPTHQYLGSQDTVMVARFITDDEEALASLDNLLRRVAYLTREYHQEVVNGFLQFDHQLARLFGVKNVVIDDMQVDTVAGQPGVYEVTLTMMAYNRAERKMHELEALTRKTVDGKNIPWNIPLVEPTPIWKVIQRGFDKIRNSIGLSMDAKQQAIYNAYVMEVFKAAELYPDLELPTYDEVEKAGFSIINLNDGIFVDPDFFIVYDEEHDFSRVLDKVMQERDPKINLYDATGGTASMNADGIKMDQIAEKKNEEAKNIAQVTRPKIAATKDISTTPDTDNMSPNDMEALIRKAATVYGLNDSYPVAFVKSFDKKFRQFYNSGANPDFGGLMASSKGIPVSQDSNFEYVGPSQNPTYIGVMRNLQSNGDVNYLKTSIEYNVDTGIRYMRYYWDVTDRLVMQGDASVQNLFDLFNRKMDSNDNVNKIHFIATLFMYLGFERELNDLLTQNKKPQQNIINLMNNVLTQLDETEYWTLDKVQKEYNELPVKDYKSVTVTDKPLETLQEIDKMDEENFKDKKDIHKSMLHDMLKYDRRGRLVRAFPTFFMTFVDEGQFIGAVKMSDQYFHYRAITDITYNNSRKQASSTLVCEMSNVFGSLDDAEKALDTHYTSFTDMFLASIFPGAVARETERNRNRDPNYYKSIYLRTGVRIHFRMGYGSNPMNMPTIMNGTITSLTNNEETITMVAQDDGIELTNKLNAALDIKPQDETSGFLSTKKEPTEILDELLTDSRGLWANISATLSNREYEKHSLGIMHFGAQEIPQGWDDFKDLLTVGLFENRSISEINMNVYQTTGLLNTEQDSWWNRLKDGLGMGKSDEVGININLFDKTVWDVLNIVSAVGPDMIAAVHPFGLRSTIFMGKPYFPIHYDYKVDLDKEEVTGTYTKSFKQLRLYDSFMSIIHNGIQATEENMYTVAVGTYLNEGKINTTVPVYVDTDIWPEKQKTVNVDTTLNAKGVWLFDKLPFIGPGLNKPFKWYFDEGVALKITAASLRDYVKDMYDGYLTVMGDPSAKPYDTFVLLDYYNNMSGPADIKEVVHIMNFDVGFVSMIKPDVMCFNTDKQIYQFAVLAASLLTSAGVTYIIREILAMYGYRGNLPILNALWAATAKSFKKMKYKFDNNKFVQKAKRFFKGPKVKEAIDQSFIKQKIEESKARIQGKVSDADIQRWKTNGVYDQIIKAFDNFNENDIDNILKKGDQFLNSKNIYDRISRDKFKKLKGAASTILLKGSKGISKGLKGGKYLGLALKGIWEGKHALLGPVGIISFLAESLVTHLITSTIGELVNRFLMTRQAVIIVPLKKDGIPFLAGVNGHKGSVVGDDPDFWQNLSHYGSILLSMIGVDAQNYETPKENERIDDIITNYATSSVSEKPRDEMVNINDVLKNMIESYKQTKFTDDGKIEERYKKDVEAARDEIKGRKELLDARSEENIKADYSAIEAKFAEMESLFSRIASFFMGLAGGGSGTVDASGDIPLDGKAVHLSKYFSVIGPKIERECKRQGVPQYAEILKALTMQETKGDYIHYPDVMQSSESLSLPRNSLGVDASIRQGVKYFSSLMRKAHGDVRTVLQSYNFGTGFIDYVNSHGGKYTRNLALQFSRMQARKNGWPRYGDVDYVNHVLQYYHYTPKSGGTDDAPTVTGTQGKQKYHLSASQANRVLIDARNQRDRAFGITIVGGTSKMRRGTYILLNELAKKYKSRTGHTFNITSAYRPGDNQWHGTGYAVDIDTPNTMRRLSGGKLGFPPGRDKENARILLDLAIQTGFNGICFGDWFLGQEMKKKYSHLLYQYMPADHYNHLHLSYPVKK